MVQRGILNEVVETRKKERVIGKIQQPGEKTKRGSGKIEKWGKWDGSEECIYEIYWIERASWK